MFVIMKGTRYVTNPGSHHSYSRELQSARRYPTRQSAQEDCCGDEHVVEL